MPLCDDVIVFYPDEEALDFRCALPEGHAERHVDESLMACWEEPYSDGWWHDEDTCTHPVPETSTNS